MLQTSATALVSLLAIILPTSTQGASHPLKLEVAAHSTAGVWIIAYEHQPYIQVGTDKYYDYNKLGERTSKIGMAFAPQATVSWGPYRAATEFEMGSYDYRGGGRASLKSAKLELGWSPGGRRGVTGAFVLTYQWFHADIKNLDTLFVNHTVNSLGFGVILGSVPQNSFRWRWSGIAPLPVLTHLFSWEDVIEHQGIFSSELTFGIRPRRSPVFFDLGYGFWAADRPIEVHKHDVVNSILSIRHGLILRAGYLK